MSSIQPWELFPQRISSPARAKMTLPYRILGDLEKEDHINKLLEGFSGESSKALYIHIPFCKQNCRFCGYYKTHGWSDEEISSYIDALALQMDRLQAKPWVKNSTFEALYFGGGSPSVLGQAAFSKIMHSIQSSLKFTADVEITVELTLNQANRDYIQVLKRLGVNRISLGVQSFNTGIRQNLGRITAGEEVESIIQMIHEEGIRNICIDLIYGLPNQTIKEWESDLDILKKLPVTGCSVYPLIPFPNSAMVMEKEFRPLSNEDAYAFFSLADKFLLDQKDWKAFSPVQYGHQTNGTAKYISLTGLQGDVLALGPSSGGNLANYQYLSRYEVAECLSKPFDFLLNSQWRVIDSEFLEFFSLFQLSEGQGISISQMESLGLRLTELSEEKWFKHLIKQEDEKLLVNRSGRFWAGNISSIISQKIAQSIS